MIMACGVSPARVITADCPRKTLPRGAVGAVVIPALRDASIAAPTGRIMSAAWMSGWGPGRGVECEEKSFLRVSHRSPGFFSRKTERPACPGLGFREGREKTRDEFWNGKTRKCAPTETGVGPAFENREVLGGTLLRRARVLLTR